MYATWTQTLVHATALLLVSSLTMSEACAASLIMVDAEAMTIDLSYVPNASGLAIHLPQKVHPSPICILRSMRDTFPHFRYAGMQAASSAWQLQRVCETFLLRLQIWAL